MMCVTIRASCVTRGSPAGELDNLSNDDHLKFIKNVRLDVLRVKLAILSVAPPPENQNKWTIKKIVNKFGCSVYKSSLGLNIHKIQDRHVCGRSQ